MKRSLGVALCLAMLVPAIAAAQDTYMYWGPHPVNPVAGGGFCYDGASHSHPYGVDPALSYLYRDYNSHYYFVGNVYEFGYQRQGFAYYGHHPLPAELGGTYCYLDGSHYHHFVPPATFASSYLVHNGYYYYNGGFPPVYYSYRPAYYRNAYTYRYLPAYRTHFTRYGSYRTTYARPASISYIYNPPARVYSYTPRTAVYPRTSVYYPRTAVTTTRTYTTTAARPVYRYNTHQPSTYNSYYRRPVTTTTTTFRPTGTVRSTTTYRPSGAAVRTTTVRSWRR